MGITGQLSRKTLERYSHARMEAKRAAVRTLDKAPEEQAKGELGTGQEGSPQISPQSRVGEGEVIQ
jgi:hypothetical protein